MGSDKATEPSLHWLWFQLSARGFLAHFHSCGKSNWTGFPPVSLLLSLLLCVQVVWLFFIFYSICDQLVLCDRSKIAEKRSTHHGDTPYLWAELRLCMGWFYCSWKTPPNLIQEENGTELFCHLGVTWLLSCLPVGRSMSPSDLKFDCLHLSLWPWTSSLTLLCTVLWSSATSVSQDCTEAWTYTDKKPGSASQCCQRRASQPLWLLMYF